MIDWTVLIQGDGTFTNYTAPASDITTAWVLVTVGTNQNYAPCGQDYFKVSSSLCPTPVTTGEYHWFEKDWERATNFEVTIVKP
jgi:hypothetical protein